MAEFRSFFDRSENSYTDEVLEYALDVMGQRVGGGIILIIGCETGGMYATGIIKSRSEYAWLF